MVEKKSSSRAIVIVLAAASALGTAAMFYYIRWLAHYVSNVSTSVESNAIYLLVWALILFAVSFAEAFIVRDIHRLMRRGEEKMHFSGRDEVSKEIQRRIKETKVLWTVYMGVPVLVNVVLMNFLSGGFVLSGQGGFSRYATIATMLRSEDDKTRFQGIEEAAANETRELGIYLAGIIEEKGELSGYAAWAAAMRKDEAAGKALRALYIGGNKEQKIMAVLGLSELKDIEGMKAAYDDLKKGRGPTLNIVIGMGKVPFMEAEDALIRIAENEKEPEPVRAAAFWAISKIGQERFKQTWERDSNTFGYDPRKWQAPERKGWEPMVAVLEGDSMTLKCGAVQALRYTGPPNTSKDLMKLFESTDRVQACNQLAIRPYKYMITEIVTPGLLRADIIRALAGIGNRGIVSWLEKVGKDRDNADEVILLARDLARQIRELK
ncbi:MAG: hypothetical protein ABIJ56_20830 [Pseudomonadota bacterium]